MARPEQLFVGCPFQSRVRKNYDRLKAELEAETPLRVVLPEGHRDGVADTATVTSSDDLLEHITALIRDSAACLFDATGANPNVSLEVGIAHALPTDFLLTVSTRQPPALDKARKAGRSAADRLRPIPSRIPCGMRSAIPSGMLSAMRSAIIADLQGRNRIEYKTYRSLKEQVLRRRPGTLSPSKGAWPRDIQARFDRLSAPALARVRKEPPLLCAAGAAGAPRDPRLRPQHTAAPRCRPLRLRPFGHRLAAGPHPPSPDHRPRRPRRRLLLSCEVTGVAPSDDPCATILSR